MPRGCCTAFDPHLQWDGLWVYIFVHGRLLQVIRSTVVKFFCSPRTSDVSGEDEPPR